MRLRRLFPVATLFGAILLACSGGPDSTEQDQGSGDDELRAAKEGAACKSFGNPTLPKCKRGLVCQPGPIPDTAHCVHR